MALDMVEEIRRAESRADEVEEEGKRQAAQLLALAQEKANTLRQEHLRIAQEERTALLRKAEEEAQALQDEARRLSGEELRRLEEQAEQRRQQAMKHAFPCLLGKEAASSFLGR